jgi:hypothetical protein
MPRLKRLCMAPVLAALAVTITAGAGARQTSGGAAQKPVPRIKESDLPKTPIDAFPLRITVTEFHEVGFIGQHYAWIKMVIENPSKSFVTFAPSRFEIVGKAGEQVNILGIPQAVNFVDVQDPGVTGAQTQILPAVDIDVAPSSHVKTFYQLTDRSVLPAELYYDRKPIAEIVK